MGSVGRPPKMATRRGGPRPTEAEAEAPGYLLKRAQQLVQDPATNIEVVYLPSAAALLFVVCWVARVVRPSYVQQIG